MYRIWETEKVHLALWSTQRKYVFDVTSVDCSSPWLCKVSGRRDKISPRVWGPFSLCAIYVAVNALNYLISKFRSYKVLIFLTKSWLLNKREDERWKLPWSRHLCSSRWLKIGSESFELIRTRGLERHPCPGTFRSMMTHHVALCLLNLANIWLETAT